ncbi:MAG: PH domain-containing protein [Dermatophilaceae bacterium]
MARQPRIDRELARYLVYGETVVVAARRHWFHLIKEILLVAGATALALWADLSTSDGGSGPVLRNITLALFWVSLAWFLWALLNWRHDWFVVTDKRFLLFYGFIRRKVAMLPLLRVTDMTYDRTVLGRIVGYGRFVLESAGQTQALSVIEHVPDADRHYRAICTKLFGSDPADTGDSPDADAGSDDDIDPTGSGPRTTAGDHSDFDDGTGSRTDTEREAETVGSGSRRSLPASPIRMSGRGHPRKKPSAQPEAWYRNSTIGGVSRTEDPDTGEIPVIRAGQERPDATESPIRSRTQR